MEMNNRLVQLAEDEAAEIARILAALTDLLRGQAGPLQFAAQTIAEMDSIFARGALRARVRLRSADVLHETQFLKLEAARHPVLEARLRGSRGERGADDA